MELGGNKLRFCCEDKNTVAAHTLASTQKCCAQVSKADSSIAVLSNLERTVSGEAPQQPVASRKSGNVFERRLIEQYISENHTDPVNGEELSTDDLIDLRTSRTVKPRPPTLTSIPALLSTFQNEWDALILETYQLKQQLAETRQELSTALYYNDSAQRVIARLQGERDEARDALARVTVTSNGGAATNGDAMQVDGQELPEIVVAKIEDVQSKLSGTRRKRPVPEDWAAGETIASYDVKSTADTQFTGARKLAVDMTGDFFLCGDSDGDIGVYDLKQGAFTTRSNFGAGGILDGAWAQDKAVVSTSSGAVVVTQGGSVTAKFHQHAGAATGIAVHPSGDLAVSCGSDKSYVLYDLHESKVLTQIYTDVGTCTSCVSFRCSMLTLVQNSRQSPSTLTVISWQLAPPMARSSSLTSRMAAKCTFSNPLLAHHPYNRSPSPRTAPGSHRHKPTHRPSRSGISAN